MMASRKGRGKEKRVECGMPLECVRLGCVDCVAGSAASGFQWLPSDSDCGSHHGCEKESAPSGLSHSPSLARANGSSIFRFQSGHAARHSPANAAVVKFFRRERPNFGAPEKTKAQKQDCPREGAEEFRGSFCDCADTQKKAETKVENRRTLPRFDYKWREYLIRRQLLQVNTP
ncbi:uncharacterized protein LOC122320764 isoform X2 [Drosophila ficusphila]|uniref:uncharacterized protein LOC122320764 isoform X2 n=1 Tax=Drosophila ficusphila TaxID=30025 RepID=UPI001C898C5E|nr:uncharacterized protein LOC122320764 isoform X2 [Drosophila ficusphila]